MYARDPRIAVGGSDFLSNEKHSSGKDQFAVVEKPSKFFYTSRLAIRVLLSSNGYLVYPRCPNILHAPWILSVESSTCSVTGIPLACPNNETA